jgi:uncharacterized membrane protein YraQ (UPF0718 family)
MTITWLITFKAIFLGIFLEALPYILIGVVLSSLIHVYLPEQWIQKHVPKHPLKGILFAIGFGFLFPICECGIIPVIKRLVQKGMPVYIGVVLLVVGPIFNPVVLLATHTAFQAHPSIFYLRFILAILIGTRIGLSFSFVKDASEVIKENRQPFKLIHSDANARPTSTITKLKQVITHAMDEFYDMGTYLLLGSVLTALIQVGVPRGLFSIFSDGLLSHVFMVAFAYVLSLCSTSDAFVGYSFWNIINHKAILTFLVFGPMLDLKSTFMLMAAFNKKFVRKYVFLVFLLVGLMAGAMEFVGRVWEGMQ